METRRQANLESGQEPVQALIYRIEDFFSAQASTRGVSLLRFLWPLMIWTRVGSEWILFRNLEPWRFGVALLFFAATTAIEETVLLLLYGSSRHESTASF